MSTAQIPTPEVRKWRYVTKVVKLGNLHVLWMVAYAFNELCWFDLARADFMNGRKEWEPEEWKKS